MKHQNSIAMGAFLLLSFAILAPNTSLAEEPIKAAEERVKMAEPVKTAVEPIKPAEAPVKIPGPVMPMEEPVKPAEPPVRLLCKFVGGPWLEALFNICNACVTPDSATRNITWKVTPDVFEGVTGVLRDSPTLLYRYAITINRASGHAELYKKFFDVENKITTRHHSPEAQGVCEASSANKF